MSTLIIGARCSDGVVLAADRRELRGYEPSEQGKIRQIPIGVQGATGSVLLAGAGVAAFWDEVGWSLAKSADAEAEPNMRTFLDVVDRVSNLSISLSARYQRDGLDERLGCVLAGLDNLTGGEARLYYFAGAGFSETGFICLGSGGSYALPMADLLLHRQLLTAEAVQVMPLLFILVERVNLSVGGGPDVFVIRDGEQAAQAPASQVEEARASVSTLLGRLPVAFDNIVENPAILRQLL